MTNRVRIHDLNNGSLYIVTRWQDAHGDTDKSAAQEAFRTGELIMMGKVIAEPLIERKSRQRATTVARVREVTR